jgi:hypothetical protein
MPPAWSWLKSAPESGVTAIVTCSKYGPSDQYLSNASSSIRVELIDVILYAPVPTWSLPSALSPCAMCFGDIMKTNVRLRARSGAGALVTRRMTVGSESSTTVNSGSSSEPKPPALL